MKKMFAVVVAVLVALVAASAFAFEPPIWMMQSTTKTADASCATTPGYFYGLIIVTDGTNAPSIDIYDNPSTNSGTKLVPTLQLAATPRIQTLNLDPPVPYQTGIYVDVTVGGGGSIAYMCYNRKR